MALRLTLLALCLMAASCSPGTSSTLTASPIHQWLEGDVEAWLAKNRPLVAWETTSKSSSSSFDGLPWAHKSLFETELGIQGDVPVLERVALLGELGDHFALRCKVLGAIRVGSETTSRSSRDCTIAYAHPIGAGEVSFEFIDAHDGLLHIKMAAHEVAREGHSPVVRTQARDR